MTPRKEGQARPGAGKRLKAAPLPDNDLLWQNEVVIGQSQPKQRPLSPRPEGRGRGLPHQYPWIDGLEGIELGGASQERAGRPAGRRGKPE